MQKIVIGIDPDCEKSGMAVFDGKTMTAESVPFPLLIDKVRETANASEVRVIVEAGWLNHSHWHIAASTSPWKAASLGNSVGRNHETGRKIVEMLRYYGLEVQEIKPLRKFWSGTDRKITQEQLNQQLQIRGIPPLKRCSQDARDAALIALVYAQ